MVEASSEQRLAAVYGTVAVYTIGQTPRPDLTGTLGARFPGVKLRVKGLLDGLAAAEIPAASGHGYPLETRLADGTRVVVDAEFLRPRLKRALEGCDGPDGPDGPVDAHLVLCAGPFPRLASAAPVILPFETGAKELARDGRRSLEIVVPFAAQAEPAQLKWEAAGFTCRVHDLGSDVGSPSHARAVSRWLRERRVAPDADAWVFDYVGLPSDVLDAADAAVDLPVFDLGRVGLDALTEVIRTR